MIERLAWRTGGFVGTTAERTLRSIAQVLPGARRPPRRSRLVRALPTVAGTVVGLAAGAATASGRTGPGGAARSRPVRATTDLAQKSRRELYELARKAGIDGRSGMSKKELARALSR